MVKPRGRTENYNWYNDWHRKRLPDHCYMTDIDTVEIRFGDDAGIKAFIEVKSREGEMSEVQLRVATWLSKKTGVNYYMVKYTAGIDSHELDYLSPDTRFELYIVKDQELEPIAEMSENQYIHWLSSL